MIEIGRKNVLKILRDTSVGLFLGDDEGNDVLLPNKYVPESYEIGGQIEVFCYLDYDERPVATTLEPDIMLGEFRLLQVAEVNEFGAFMDWGLEKHLLVPFREQRSKMKQGQWYVVHCYLDEKTGRLVASNKLDKFLSNENLNLKEWEEVDLVIIRQTELGWEVIVNEKHKGLVYFNEVFKSINIGDVIPGCVKKIRKDNKLDISLQPLGTKVLEPAANKIYNVLKEKGGFLPLHDKSDPEDIMDMFQMSKKTFKKGLGTLYKERKVALEKDGIRLAQ
ncbi:MULTISPECIES: S1 RNA-binding domain-containing protein [Maribacter]|uniref:S1-like domain-containing RNA-binding protein n=1 Tax=Maribacter flavus TaxID=1658664 RepID=A0ABU7IK85_9FLAO|nr:MULTISPECIES: S1-like domain-containing RNA-binding protein [Maribacter]MDC6405757.1 S1-like domain-containing RNA-binding protein [Maribacter sp. PR66]MEE1972991.1 S1-like domain-containing RNA-binding protein [Maribacter flavus]